MANIPHVLEPRQPVEDGWNETVNSTSTKSRFKSLFQWHKNGQTIERPSTKDGDKSGNTPRPQLSPRSFSERPTGSKSVRFHSADGPRNRKRERILTDPPPLAQAYWQASVHATLDTPVSFTEIVRSSQASLSAKKSQDHNALEDVVRIECAHKKSNSGDDTCATKSKIFMLIHGPYLLQFPADAEANTLPEKILVLDRDCVALACDAVPGNPWVLQISKTSSLMQTAQGKTLRPSWSRLTLRQPEDKRTVNTMLLIFNDSEELYTWLFALRKEIEHLGGMEYRPGTANDDRTWRDNLTRRFDSSSSEIRDHSRSSLEHHRAESKVATYSKTTHYQIDTTRSPSPKSPTSSTQTKTSLERLRDSLTSNEFQSDLARVSATDSASSASPTTDCFPSIGSVTGATKNDLSLRAFSRANSARSGRSRSQPNRSSILERRKLSVGSLTLTHSEAAKPWSGFSNLPPTITGSPNDDVTQAQSLPPVLSAGVPDESFLPVTKTNPIELPEIRAHAVDQSIDNSCDTTRNSSQSETAIAAAKPKYTLFPVRSVPESKDEPLARPDSLIESVSPPSKSQPTSRVASRATSRTSHTQLKSYPKHRKTRMRTVTLELRQHRKSALLGVGQFDTPLRSPSVTDDMIMCNFGVQTKGVPLSPMPPSKVPGLADLTFDLDFLRMPYEQQVKRPSLGNQRTPSTRSVASAHSDRSATFSSAPAGPPPVRPLPAVPQRNSQATNRSSQSSQYSDMSHYSSRKGTTQRSKPVPVMERALLRNQVSVVKRTASGKLTQHKHTRTVSSALNVPDSAKPPPLRIHKQGFI